MSNPLASLVAPMRCVACGRRGGPPWCTSCAGLVHPAPTGCPACLDPWTSHACPTLGSAWRSTVGVWAYEGPVRAAIVAAKARGAWAGWEHLAGCLADRVHEATPLRGGAEVVTWVPGRPRVVRRRGIDHARVLAEAVAARLQVPIVPLLVAGDAAGRRVGATSGRRGTSAPGQALREEFRWRRGARAVERVLLVDDVLTTGATARAATRALADGGVRTTALAVLARTATESGQSDN